MSDPKCLRLLPALPGGYDDRTHCPRCGFWVRHGDLWKTDEYYLDPLTGCCRSLADAGLWGDPNVQTIQALRKREGLA